MKYITLTRTKRVALNDKDFIEQSQFKWSVTHIKYRWYATRLDGKPPKRIYMHREIIKAPMGVKVDHKDGNGLNNQRGNLRLATNSQNGANRGRNRNNKSGYKGVSWDARNGKWRASISINHLSINLGRFTSRRNAAMVYDAAARLHFGEFASVNFPKRFYPGEDA